MQKETLVDIYLLSLPVVRTIKNVIISISEINII